MEHSLTKFQVQGRVQAAVDLQEAVAPAPVQTPFQKNLATAVRKKVGLDPPGASQPAHSAPRLKAPGCCHPQARQREQQTGVVEFMHKLRQAWHIFFPAQPADITPKDEGKHRLRMILVADRCVASLHSLLSTCSNVAGARRCDAAQVRHEPVVAV